MSAVAEAVLEAEDGLETPEFFAPAPPPDIVPLFRQYHEQRERIEQVATFIGEQEEHTVDCFIKGNIERRNQPYARDPREIFACEGAIAELDARFWQRALDMTDIHSCLPEDERERWRNAIFENRTAPFTEENVEATLSELLASRERFFAERVDGVFRALSGAHVTNRPEGCSKRMILSGVYWMGDIPETHETGYIHDLRSVIAKFTGRGEPAWHTTMDALREARAETGTWFTIDGGVMRVRAYKKGTCHLEVHPKMAWRLNQVLAMLYPRAIPANKRQAPKKNARFDFELMEDLLPFEVLNYLARVSIIRPREEGAAWRIWLSSNEAPRFVKHRACEVLEALGGVNRDGDMVFDFHPSAIVKQVVRTGRIPDAHSHQFYPTPAPLAKELVASAGIGTGDRCLEPSAGIGHIARFLPKGETCCVEASALRCEVLRARGHRTIEADFLRWAKTTTERFERIEMNPPYSEGRWQAHLEAAAGLLAPGGRLAAVLPASARGKTLLEGFEHDFSAPRRGGFQGTGIEVTLFTAWRAHNG